MMMRSHTPALIVMLALTAGCGKFIRPPFSNPNEVLPRPSATAPVPVEPLPSAELAAPPPPSGAVTVTALDTTTEAQKAAALAVPVPEAEAALGTVVVSLGAATEPGLWLRSTLVSAARPGTVKLASGKSVAVDLLPGSGAPQLSLPAYLALGLALTDLPEVTIYAR